MLLDVYEYLRKNQKILSIHDYTQKYSIVNLLYKVFEVDAT